MGTQAQRKRGGANFSPGNRLLCRADPCFLMAKMV